MKNIQTITLAILLLVPALSVMAKEIELLINVKEQRTLPVPADLERIAVADPDIADVVVLSGNRNRPGSILLVGKKPGTTTVSAWSRNRIETVWQVRVQSQLLGQIPATDAEIRTGNGSTLIRGESPSVVSHAVTTAVAGQNVGKNEAILDAATVRTGGMVQIDVKIVEFSKNVLKEAGFDFLINKGQGTFSFGLLNGNAPILNEVTNRYTFNPATQAFNLLNRGAINTRVRLIEENGLGRILAQPSLIALSGHSANFLAGGELPIPQSGGLGTTTITFKPFGIGVTVTPTVLSADRIVLKVAPEASDIDASNGITINNITIPSISTRRAETTLELGNGESFIIGGLVSRTTRSNAAKVPFLGDLPIIGTFFRSMQYTQDERELVMIVTPHLVRPFAKGAVLPLPGDDREKIDSAGNAWGAYLLGIASRDELPGFSK